MIDLFVVTNHNISNQYIYMNNNFLNVMTLEYVLYYCYRLQYLRSKHAPFYKRLETMNGAYKQTGKSLRLKTLNNLKLIDVK